MGTDAQGKSLAKKLDSAITTNQRVPGPGSYSMLYSQAMKTSPGWRIGSSKRGEVEKIRQRVANFPPPDSYDPNFQATKSKLASWSFGSSKRTQVGKKNLATPAPGTYEIPSKAVDGPKFNMGLKLDNMSSIG